MSLPTVKVSCSYEQLLHREILYDAVTLRVHISYFCCGPANPKPALYPCLAPFIPLFVIITLHVPPILMMSQPKKNHFWTQYSNMMCRVQADSAAGRLHHLLHLLLYCAQCHSGKQLVSLLACLKGMQSAAYPDMPYTASPDSFVTNQCAGHPACFGLSG